MLVDHLSRLQGHNWPLKILQCKIRTMLFCSVVYIFFFFLQYMSFSAHADAKGIMQLISHCCPANVMLVHGEAAKMEFLKVSGSFDSPHFVEISFPLEASAVSNKIIQLSDRAV